MNDDSGTIQLLAEARTGDRGGMGRLAVLVWERLYPFVFRTTLDHDATEDILQETLLTMLRRLGSLRNEKRFWPWMYHIAWSRIRDRLRGCQLRSRREAEFAQHGAVGSSGHESDLTPLDAQIREETLREISMAITQLNRRQRDIVQLRCYEQLPYTEIATLTQTTPELARTHFHRAKNALKKHLACCT